MPAQSMTLHEANGVSAVEVTLTSGPVSRDRLQASRSQVPTSPESRDEKSSCEENVINMAKAWTVHPLRS